MVYYKTGKGAKRKKVGVTIGAGPVKITSAKPSLRKQVFNVKKTVKEMQSKEELKYLDTFMNGTVATSTSTLTLLNGLTQGDNVSNREGDSISPTSIQCKFNLSQVATAVQYEINVRHIVFWDSQANGAAPAAGDLLDLATITQAVLAPYKRQYQKRFKIVSDKSYVMHPKVIDPATAGEVVAATHHGGWKRSLSRVVKYRNSQNTGTITDIATNSLYSLWVTNDSSANLAVFCGYRMYFKDD